MNVDTGTFNAICNQVADIGFDVGDLEASLGEVKQVQTVILQLLARMIRLLEFQHGVRYVPRWQPEVIDGDGHGSDHRRGKLEVVR